MTSGYEKGGPPFNSFSFVPCTFWKQFQSVSMVFFFFSSDILNYFLFFGSVKWHRRTYIRCIELVLRVYVRDSRWTSSLDTFALSKIHASKSLHVSASNARDVEWRTYVENSGIHHRRARSTLTVWLLEDRTSTSSYLFILSFSILSLFFQTSLGPTYLRHFRVVSKFKSL